MAQKQAKAPPPYATFPTFINFLNKLRETSIPGRIDPSVFGNASGSLIYSIISSLKGLSLIDENGAPQPAFNALVNASDEERKPLVTKLLKSAYPALWKPGMDLEKMTAGQFDDFLRDEYQINGSTIDKSASFFISAANYADIPISPLLKSRKPIASSSASRKSAKQRKKGDDDGNQVDQNLPPPPPPAHDAKPLEYQLIDLMKEPDIEDGVKQSIWSLVQYLMARKAKTPNEADDE